MKLQPYAQTSVAKRANHKLSFKYFGPYEILARVGKVAYKLRLPDNSQVHPVLHVSQLKKMVPPSQVHTTDLSFNFLIDELFLVQPAKVQQNRLIRHGRGHIPQVLVSWTGLPATLCTWESEAALRCRFLEHLLGGKQFLKKGGMLRHHTTSDIVNWTSGGPRSTRQGPRDDRPSPPRTQQQSTLSLPEDRHETA